MKNLIGTFFLILALACIYIASYILNIQTVEWYGFANYFMAMVSVFIFFGMGLTILLQEDEE